MVSEAHSHSYGDRSEVSQVLQKKLPAKESSDSR